MAEQIISGEKYKKVNTIRLIKVTPPILTHSPLQTSETGPQTHTNPQTSGLGINLHKQRRKDVKAAETKVKSETRWFSQCWREKKSKCLIPYLRLSENRINEWFHETWIAEVEGKLGLGGSGELKKDLQIPHPVGRRKPQDNILSTLITKRDKSTTESYISGVQQTDKAARYPGELNTKDDSLSKDRWDTWQRCLP